MVSRSLPSVVPGAIMSTKIRCLPSGVTSVRVSYSSQKRHADANDAKKTRKRERIESTCEDQDEERSR